MKVLLINGSPRKNGNTALALSEMEKVFHEEGVETELVHIGAMDIRGCMACGFCRKNGRCVFNDVVNDLSKKFEQSDGLVIGAPVYYGSANATLMAAMQRMFYSSPFDKTMKVGAAVASARRGGLTAAFDEMNKFFTISGMPVASGQYWNGIHGGTPGQGAEDAEGLQMMRTLARNMSFLMKAIAEAKEKNGLPEKEEHIFTNFIR
ncbi:MAG: flavodoxin family protein [Flexilinea sp.]|nr:flavodoxin family protein [Flexilinea sp.]